MRLITQTWNHTEPEDQDSELQLLTICGISVIGTWSGALGEHYVGWCKPYRTSQTPLPPHNHNNEERMYTQ